MTYISLVDSERKQPQRKRPHFLPCHSLLKSTVHKTSNFLANLFTISLLINIIRWEPQLGRRAGEKQFYPLVGPFALTVCGVMEARDQPAKFLRQGLLGEYTLLLWPVARMFVQLLPLLHPAVLGALRSSWVEIHFCWCFKRLLWECGATTDPTE